MARIIYDSDKIPPNFKPGADLAGIEIHDKRFRQLNLSGANLESAVIMHCDLGAAKFKGANLHGAELSGSNLSYSNFEGANLSGAILYMANFHSANLKGADLSDLDAAGGTIFSGADLRGAILPSPDCLVGGAFYGTILDAEQLPIIREAIELTLATLKVGGRTPRAKKTPRTYGQFDVGDVTPAPYGDEVPGEESAEPYTPGRFENPRRYGRYGRGY
jgi:hypothetical protein